MDLAGDRLEGVGACTLDQSPQQELGVRADQAHQHADRHRIPDVGFLNLPGLHGGEEPLPLPVAKLQEPGHFLRRQAGLAKLLGPGRCPRCWIEACAWLTAHGKQDLVGGRVEGALTVFR